VLLDHHEHVQHAERRGDHDEEVTCENRFGMVFQEGRPTLITTRLAWRSLRHVLPDRSWRHAYTQLHQQLIRDALLAPQWILDRHPSNKLPQFERNRRPTRSGFVAPEHSPARSMPTHNCLGPNDDHAGSPVT
jgi:hypothetical protein